MGAKMQNVLTELRIKIDDTLYRDEHDALVGLVETAALSDADRARIGTRAADLVRKIRASA